MPAITTKSDTSTALAETYERLRQAVQQHARLQDEHVRLEAEIEKLRAEWLATIEQAQKELERIRLQQEHAGAMPLDDEVKRNRY